MNFFTFLKSNSKAAVFIRTTVILIIIILLFSLLSRFLYGSGETLEEHARLNEEVLPTPSGNLPDTFQEDIPDTTSQEVPDMTGDSALDPNSDTDAGQNEKTSIEDSFYYEPLSEELKTYITGISYPDEGTTEIDYDDLSYVHVLHWNFEDEETEGELICNQAIAQDLTEIFYELYLAGYQIEKIRLIDAYNGDDEASMEDNNTSCFNYRDVSGSNKLSSHAYGLAIDINPFYNPYVRYQKEGGQIVQPEGSEIYTDRLAAFPYKIDQSDLCYQLFTKYGFTWGGNWNSSKDYQHFQKQVN
jgi:hypothetical protein